MRKRQNKKGLLVVGGEDIFELFDVHKYALVSVFKNEHS